MHPPRAFVLGKLLPWTGPLSPLLPQRASTLMPSPHLRHAGQTTALGAPKPDAWVAVQAPDGKSMYYWNQQSNETTAVGEPRPGLHGRLQQVGGGGRQQGGSPLFQLVGYPLAMGLGVGLVFGIIRVLF